MAGAQNISGWISNGREETEAVVNQHDMLKSGFDFIGVESCKIYCLMKCRFGDFPTECTIAF